jgi:hypothetical protein
MMTKTTKVNLPQLYTRAQFAPGTLDMTTRTVHVVWSTGARVRRYRLFEDAFDEELSLQSEHVRLERLNQGAPLLNSHQGNNLSDVIGVVERAWIENGFGVAKVRFSSREDVTAIVRDVEEGILRQISVGYFVHRYDDITSDHDKTRLLRAVDWEPFELSLVPINADANAQIRDQSCESLCEITIKETYPVNEESITTTEELSNTTSCENKTSDNTESDSIHSDTLLQKERERSSTILHTVRTANLDHAFAEQWIREGISIDEVRKRTLEKLTTQTAQSSTRNYLRVEIGQDETQTRREGMQAALLHRFDPSRYQSTDIARPYAGLSLMELARETVEKQGTRTRGLSKLDIAQRAMHTTSDFPLILANVVNKTLRDAYASAPQTFRPFVRETTAPDFKLITRVQLGDAPQLQKVNEHGEFTYGTIGEAQEQYQVASYGKIISFSRQTLINDDLDALTRIPQLFGRAAANLESELVYSIFRDNPKMGDGKPIFAAPHNNLDSTGAAITVDAISLGRTALRLQTGLNGERLSITPQFLLVPAALETIADQFISQNFQPNVQIQINPFAGRLQVISEPRVDDASATAWYLLADPSQIDLIEIAYLEGQRGVQIETRTGFEVDGLEIKARLDVGVKAIDWRGFYKNIGKNS